MTTAAESAWYALYVRPQHEKKVAAALDTRSIEHYLPLSRQKRKWSDRIKLIDFPVFPGYLFVRIDWATAHTQVLSLPGAISFVRVQGKPAPMDAQEIENLRAFIVAAQEVEVGAEERFPPGQEVRIRFGALKGVTGVVTRIKSKRRLFIRVPLLNQFVSAEVDMEDIEPEV